ncbi:hypothetical protein AB1N83_006311 [Pleurotus pulmonarius]
MYESPGSTRLSRSRELETKLDMADCGSADIRGLKYFLTVTNSSKQKFATWTQTSNFAFTESLQELANADGDTNDFEYAHLKTTNRLPVEATRTVTPTG